MESAKQRGKVRLFVNYITDLQENDCRVITVPGTDREKRETTGLVLAVIFRLHTGFIEGTDGWASAGINLLLILTANTFASVYPTLGAQSVQIISERKQMECESNVKISLRIRLSTGNRK